MTELITFITIAIKIMNSSSLIAQYIQKISQVPKD